MNIWLIVLIVVVLLALYLWITYNSLISLKEKIKEALSQIDVQLKRRTDLIPNLVETVKGYAKHEKEAFQKITEARTSIMNAKSPHEKAEANNMFESALKSIFAVAEAYPDLKASQNFLNLQEELTDTENKVSYSRQFYNSNVLAYNTSIKTFPAALFALKLGFKEAEFFEATAEEKKEVKVEF